MPACAHPPHSSTDRGPLGASRRPVVALAVAAPLLVALATVHALGPLIIALSAAGAAWSLHGAARRSGPFGRAPWDLLAASLLTLAFGHLLAGPVAEASGATARRFLRDAGNIGTLLGYVGIAAAVVTIVRARTARSGRPPLGDLAITAIGAAEAVWLSLVRPGAELAPNVPVLALVLVLTDLTIFAALVFGLVAGRLSAVPAGRLLAGGVLAMVLSDSAASIGAAGGEGSELRCVAGFALASLFCAAAAHHRSMSELTERLAPGHTAAGLRRLALLGAACLAPPCTMLAYAVVQGATADIVVALGAVAAFGLLVVRLSGAQDAAGNARRREQALRSALMGLLAATDRSTIELAVVLGVRQVLDDPLASVRLAWEGGGGEAVGPWEPGPSMWSASLQLAASRDDGAPGRLEVVTVVDGSSVLDSLELLAAQAGLALERAALTAEMHRRQGERRLTSLVQNAFDVIIVLGADLCVQYQSSGVAAMLGHGPDDLVGGDLCALVHPDDEPAVAAHLKRLGGSAPGVAERVECRLWHRNEEWLDVELTATNLLDDADIGGIVLNVRDVSEHKALEAQLLRQAFHDPLTGLANRVLLTERVSQALLRTERGGSVPSVFFIDLDDFKVVNDSYGHPAGDRLLVEVADRVSGCLRHGDTASRLGGDEFGVLLEERDPSRGELTALEVAQRVLEVIGRPLQIDGAELHPRASIGVATGSEGMTAAELLRNADLAMYIAKANGGGVVVFQPEMHDSALRRMELQTELRRALESDEFEVHFQPLVDLDGEGVVGVEALTRWRHPTRGLVSPVEFIPLAEQTGLIVPLGQWVLEEACATVASWAGSGLVSSLSLTVNVSARQLQEPGHIRTVAQALERSGIDPSWLVVEITESVLMRDTEATIGWLHELKALGVRIAIDDFGTGYSSLAYLQRFPIDVLKIDRSFVTGLGLDPKASELVRAVISLADSLGMTTLAEGIEDRRQLAELRMLGCTLGQGFAFSPALDAPSLAEALAAGELPGPAVSDQGQPLGAGRS